MEATKSWVTQSSSRASIPIFPAPAALLRAVGAGAGALDVAGVGDGHHHVLFLDEILFVDLRLGLDDLGATLVGVLGADLLQLHHDHVEEELLVGEDGPQAGDGLAQLAVLGGQLLGLQPGEAGEAHLQDRLGLSLGEEVIPPRLGGLDLRCRPPRALYELLQPAEGEGHQLRAGVFAVAGAADGPE